MDKSTERASLSFEEFATFVRDWAAIPKRKEITPETLFEDDLGITGDDGCELLEETERRFGVRLSSPEHGYRETFNLAPHEVLFNSEGFGPNWHDIMALFRPSVIPASVKRFTVGELFVAVRNAQANQRNNPSIFGHEP
jgi:hypothetical protein